MMTRVLRIALAACMSAGAAASSEEITSQPEINEGVADLFMKTDKELNSAYAALRKAISACGADYAPAQRRLKAAQRDWIKFRDSNCEYASGHLDGGQAWSSEYNGCRVTMTQARTKELQEMLAQFKDTAGCVTAR